MEEQVDMDSPLDELSFYSNLPRWSLIESSRVRKSPETVLTGELVLQSTVFLSIYICFLGIVKFLTDLFLISYVVLCCVVRARSASRKKNHLKEIL